MLSDAWVVVLENDGEWSMVAKSDSASDESAFVGIPILGRSNNSPDPHGSEVTPAPADHLP